MKISIITVVYNNQDSIKEAIESVLAQDYNNIEYIIVDGSSTDNTLSVINEYKQKISQIVSEPDNGIYDAMNKGIRMASGDVIGILNSDDIYASSSIISNVMEQFRLDNMIQAVYGDISYFHSESPDKVVRFWKMINYYETFFEDGFVMPHPSLFVRKEVYDAVGLYYSNFKISSDYEFMLRAFKLFNCKAFYLNKTIVKMRMGGRSTKNFKNILLGNKEIFMSWQMNGLKKPTLFYVKRLIFKLRQIRKK